MEHEIRQWKEKGKMLLFTALVGALCIALILLSAYTAKAQYNINKINQRCGNLESEIADLSANLQTAAGIVVIEEEAKALGMTYPSYGETVFLTAEEAAGEELATALKELAYGVR